MDTLAFWGDICSIAGIVYTFYIGIASNQKSKVDRLLP